MSWPDIARRLITPEELAQEYRFPSVEAARKWARRKNLARTKLRDADGRKVAYVRSEVEKARKAKGRLPSIADDMQSPNEPAAPVSQEVS